MEHCIIYFSRSIGVFDENDLRRILQQSHHNNAKAGVTGVLLYVRGSFIQVLEGEKAVIESLYERIEQDYRHTNVEKVLNRPITQRLFGQWSMGYETVTVRQFEEIKAVIQVKDNTSTVIQPDDHIIVKTIKAFYDSNRYN